MLFCILYQKCVLFFHFGLKCFKEIGWVEPLSLFWLFITPWTASSQVSLSFTVPRAYSNPCPSSWWCHPAISSSAVLFSSCLQSFPASGSFSKSRLFSSGGQSIGVSGSATVLSANIQDWFPLGLMSLQSKGLSSVLQCLGSTASTFWHSAFFMVQLTSIHDKKHNFDYTDLCWQSNVSAC